MSKAYQKDERILSLYTRLQRGEVLHKREEARRFHVNEKSIQRDLNSLRVFFQQEYSKEDAIIYDKRQKGYRLNMQTGHLTNGEILAVCKILLESRSLPKKDMDALLDKVLQCCVPENNKEVVTQLIANEKVHYIEPHHGVSLFDRLWDIGTAIWEQCVLEITYEKMNHEVVTRVVEPAAIMFSEYYFYLTAFIRNIDKAKEFQNADDLFPTIYRMDRIQTYRKTGERFRVCYANRFEDGEFRKRVQFMYGGRLQTLRFRYTGPSIEAILDRLPTARVEENPDGGWNVTAEVFGKGAEMWLKGQEHCSLE